MRMRGAYSGIAQTNSSGETPTIITRVDCTNDRWYSLEVLKANKLRRQAKELERSPEDPGPAFS